MEVGLTSCFFPIVVWSEWITWYVRRAGHQSLMAESNHGRVLPNFDCFAMKKDPSTRSSPPLSQQQRQPPCKKGGSNSNGNNNSFLQKTSVVLLFIHITESFRKQKRQSGHLVAYVVVSSNKINIKFDNDSPIDTYI